MARPRFFHLNAMQQPALEQFEREIQGLINKTPPEEDHSDHSAYLKELLGDVQHELQRRKEKP